LINTRDYGKTNKASDKNGGRLSRIYIINWQKVAYHQSRSSCDSLISLLIDDDFNTGNSRGF
jgi:hypothetical protein